MKTIEAQGQEPRRFENANLRDTLGDRDEIEIADGVVIRRVNGMGRVHVYRDGKLAYVAEGAAKVSFILDQIVTGLPVIPAKPRVDEPRPKPKSEPLYISPYPLAPPWAVQGPKPAPQAGESDEHAARLHKAETVASEALVKLAELGELGAYTSRIAESVREAVQSLAREVLLAWLKEHAPMYPADRAERMIKEAYQKGDQTPSQVYAGIVAVLKETADEVARERIARLAMERGGWGEEKIRPSKRVVRIRMDIFSSYDGRPEIWRHVDHLTALEIFIGEALGERVTLLAAVKDVVKNEDPTKKTEIAASAVKAFKFYKKGVLDLWFEDDEVADRVAEALHPQGPGDHHSCDWYRVDGHYAKCKVCGRPQRNPRYSLRNTTLIQGRSQMPRTFGRCLPAPAEHRDRQREVRAGRDRLYEENFGDIVW